jgi:hypothetical protein
LTIVASSVESTLRSVGLARSEYSGRVSAEKLNPHLFSAHSYRHRLNIEAWHDLSFPTELLGLARVGGDAAMGRGNKSAMKPLHGCGSALSSPVGFL